MDCEYPHEQFDSLQRVSQSLRNDRCQNILYKSICEHFKEISTVAALLLTSKSFQNSSFGANFTLNYIVDEDSIAFLESVLSPSSCFSLQFVPSLHIKLSREFSAKINRRFCIFIHTIARTNHLHASLRALTLNGVSNEAVHCFFGSSSSNSWTQLRDLTLENCELDEAVLEIITKNALHLCAVTLSACTGITEAGLRYVSRLSTVSRLNLSCSDRIMDGGLRHVCEMSGTTALNLTGCHNITDYGLEHVANLSNIRSLELRSCYKISDASLEQISQLSDMTSLDLFNCYEITDDGIEHVSKLGKVTALNLCYCRNITSASLEFVSKLSRITSLSLRQCRMITDYGVSHVAKLSAITSLDLSGCMMLTDNGIEHVSNLSGITFLDISSCRLITDVGIEHIANLPNITSLTVVGSSKITIGKKNNLRQALPYCVIRG